MYAPVYMAVGCAIIILGLGMFVGAFRTKGETVEEPDLPPGTEILVNGENYEWAAKVSGYSIEQLKKRYAESLLEGYVCVVKVK